MSHTLRCKFIIRHLQKDEFILKLKGRNDNQVKVVNMLK